MPTTRQRTALFTMGGVFLLWAYWNFNDPDGAVWLTVYGTAAACSLLAAFGRLPRALAVVFAAGVALGAVVQGVRVVVGGEFIFGEHGREMMGLLIISAWVLTARRWARGREQAAAGSKATVK